MPLLDGFVIHHVGLCGTFAETPFAQEQQTSIQPFRALSVLPFTASIVLRALIT
jgi:hypothetical protein